MIDKHTTSFMRSLCQGEIEEEILVPWPMMKDSEKELLQGVFTTVDAMMKPHAKDFRKWDRDGEFPPSFIEELKAAGLFSLVVPEVYGGMGFGSAAYSRAIQQLARYDASTTVTIGAHSSIGMRGLLLFGTDAQKAKYMPKLATGEMIACFCLTEPGAGSDAAAIKTTAVKDGDHWVLNGNKLWITNGGLADFFTVFAKTPETGGKAKMTAFIVTKDLKGISIGPHEDKMGLRASSTTTVHFDNVIVPAENVLGEEGKGFKVAMSILNSGRTGIGGGSVGAMKQLIEYASKQAKDRQQFGRPIAEFGLVKQKLGHMVVDTFVTESLVTMVAGLIDGGYQEYAVEAAISKVFASEALWRICDESLQIAGGNGFMCEFPYERLLRDCRINRIFEGTNEILRLFIALTAMNDVGSQLKELRHSLKGVFNDPIKGFGVLSDYAQRRARMATGFKGEKGAFTRLDPRLKTEAVIFEEATRELGVAVDRILRKHGREIIGKQFATRRLSDILIDLFALACTLARVDDALKKAGPEGAPREMEILRIFADQVRHRVRTNFHRIDDNDDELIKSLADDALEKEGYKWDSV